VTDLTLSDGRVATIREGKGRDLLAAQRKMRDSSEMIFALAAELTMVDGKPVIFEDLLDWPVQDVLAVQNAVAGNFPMPSPTAAPSSTSPT